VFRDFEDFKFDVINRRRIEKDAAVGVDDKLLVDHLLDFDDLLKLNTISTSEGRFVNTTA
jgi:hypothetical protein